MRKKFLLLIIFSVAVLGIILFFSQDQERLKTNNSFVIVTPTAEPKVKTEENFPILEFKKRITKKSFGEYISPQDSPIQKERFKGFHTGVDVEYEDIKNDVPVFAVCSGEIVLSKWVSGYGGTLILKCQENYYLYGHLNVNSIVKKTKILKGEQMALLGKGDSIETDYERKHLHFSINKKSADLRGYVQNKDELIDWENPLESDIYGN